jgi:hypothetical protein
MARGLARCQAGEALTDIARIYGIAHNSEAVVFEHHFPA